MVVAVAAGVLERMHVSGLQGLERLVFDRPPSPGAAHDRPHRCPVERKIGDPREGCRLSPSYDGRLPGRLDNRAVHKHILKVGIIRQRIGNALENASLRKAPEPLENAVPLPEPRRKIAPRTSRPHPPQNALDKLSTGPR